VSARRKIILWIGYVVFFVVCFLLFAYWSFPWDRVKALIVQEVERPMGPRGREPSGWEIEIVDLSPSWLTGVDLTGVRLTKLPETPGEPPVSVTFEEVHARVSLLSLLSGETDVGFEAVVAGGEMEGDFAVSEELLELDAEIRHVNLRQLAILRSYAGLPIGGVVDGEVELHIPAEMNQATGRVEAEIDGLTLGARGSKLRIPDIPLMREGLTIEPIQAGDLDLAVVIEAGNGRIERLRANGRDAALTADGTLTLARPFELSRLSTLLRITFTEGYKRKNEVTERLFLAMEAVPEVRAAKTTDGAYQFRLSGSFRGPMRFVGAGRSPPPGGR
jgi:type II secretion system protein N